MDTAQLTGLIVSILAFLAVIPGLWVSGKLLPRIITWIRIPDLRRQLAHPFPKLILWLCLGVLFTQPLLNLITWLANWVGIFSPSTGLVSSAFGPVPIPIYYAFTNVLMVLVYGGIFWAFTGLLPHSKQLNPTERLFILLTIASLVYKFISLNIEGFTQIPFLTTQGNLGVVSFLGGWLVGLGLLGIIILGLNRLLPNRPLNHEMPQKGR